jgi:hypothetical protein
MTVFWGMAFGLALGELLEEAHVTGVELADVGDAMLDHGDALRNETKRLPE